MESAAQPSAFDETRSVGSQWSRHLRWFALGAVAAFLVPFVFSSLLKIQHDAYLAIYFAFVIALLATYMRSNGIGLPEVIRRNWIWGLVAGILLGIPIVRNVFTETATPHPSGFYFAFELVWRGAIYGVIDAVLLTVFPCLIAYHALNRTLGTWGRRLSYFLAALAMVVTITAMYHLGYKHYRQEGVGKPETGNILMSLPMLLTVNPIGSVLDHGAMHVAAVIHEYEGETRLPPETHVH